MTDSWLLCLLLFSYTPHYLCYITKWNEGSTRAPYGKYGQLIGFDGMNFIYLLGGADNGFIQTSVYAFNIHNMTFNELAPLSTDNPPFHVSTYSSYATNSIYYIYAEIWEYNMDNNNERSLGDRPDDCGCFSIYNNQLYCVGSNTTILNLTSLTWTFGPNMNIERGFSSSCIIIDHISTMYVLGGHNTNNSIEISSINELGFMTNWTILNATLSDGIGDTVAINPDNDHNLIYIIGSNTDILNIVTNEIISGLNVPHQLTMFSSIYADKRIYLFGGRSSNGADSTFVWYYSDLMESSSPTISPTFSPTLSPSSSPTYNPTKYPTGSPTDSPTMHPTYPHGKITENSYSFIDFMKKYLNEMVLV
eukprot:151304_1